MLRNVLLVSLVALSLSGCAQTLLAPLVKDVMLGASPKAMEAKANIGQARSEGDDNVAQNANTAVSLDNGTREVFEGEVGTVVNEAGVPIHILLLIVMLAGWAIPSPEEMGHGVVRIIRAARISRR
jgi:hypothetical protein